MAGSSSQDMAGKTNPFSKFCLEHKNCIFLSLFCLFFETCFSFKMFFMPVYWQQLGLSPTQIGILRAVWGVAYSVGAVLFGKLANKFQIRRALLLMSILSTMLTPFVSLLPRRTHDNCIVKWEPVPEPVSNADFERRANLLRHTDYKRHKGYRRETKVIALEADMANKYQQLNYIIGLSPLNLLKEKEVLKHRELQTKINLNNFRILLEEERYNSITRGNHQ